MSRQARLAPERLSPAQLAAMWDAERSFVSQISPSGMLESLGASRWAARQVSPGTGASSRNNSNTTSRPSQSADVVNAMNNLRNRVRHMQFRTNSNHTCHICDDDEATVILHGNNKHRICPGCLNRWHRSSIHSRTRCPFCRKNITDFAARRMRQRGSSGSSVRRMDFRDLFDITRPFSIEPPENQM